MAKKDRTTKADDATVENTEEQAQAAVDAENEKGYRGTAVDPTPNENYTVAGVTSGAPTPETDPAYRREIRAEMEERATARTLEPEKA